MDGTLTYDLPLIRGRFALRGCSRCGAFGTLDNSEVSSQAQHLEVARVILSRLCGFALKATDPQDGVIGQAGGLGHLSEISDLAIKGSDDCRQEVGFTTHSPILRTFALPVNAYVHRQRKDNANMPTATSVLSSNLMWLMSTRPEIGSQAKLAERVGVDQTTIGRCLNMRNSPTLEKLEAIAKGLDLSVQQLLTPHDQWSQAGHYQATDERDLLLAFRRFPEHIRQEITRDFMRLALDYSPGASDVFKRFGLERTADAETVAAHIQPAPSLPPSPPKLTSPNALGFGPRFAKSRAAAKKEAKK